MAYTDIDKPTDYFNTKLYTGTGSGNQSVTGVGFQPDWVWTKTRSIGYGHNLYDSVRGTGKYLQSNSASAESSSATSMVSFDSDGFTVGTGDNVQYATNTGVSWNWLASNTTASNTDGSITSTVSANTTAGFSVGTFTKSGDTTVGHGLNSTPSLIITRHKNQASDWRVWHSSFGANEYINLNSTSAKATSTTIWQNTLPTSSVFSMGSLFDNVASVFYAFAEKKGFSKFGSYTGNGNADGTFVYTGFKPAFVMVKNSGAAENWIIFDNKRPGYNLTDALLKPNLSNAESTSGVKFDMLSNGFKARVSDAEGNSSGGSFIYMAFAENPFTTSTGVPATAR